MTRSPLCSVPAGPRGAEHPLRRRTVRPAAALALAAALLAACGADGEPEPPPGGVKVSVTGRIGVGVAGGN